MREKFLDDLLPILFAAIVSSISGFVLMSYLGSGQYAAWYHILFLGVLIFVVSLVTGFVGFAIGFYLPIWCRRLRRWQSERRGHG